MDNSHSRITTHRSRSVSLPGPHFSSWRYRHLFLCCFCSGLLLAQNISSMNRASVCFCSLSWHVSGARQTYRNPAAEVQSRQKTAKLRVFAGSLLAVHSLFISHLQASAVAESTSLFPPEVLSSVSGNPKCLTVCLIISDC